MSKKLKPLTIFLSDDELVNFKSHFDEFLNMNCNDKIKEQEEEIERLHSIIKEVREIFKDYGEKEDIVGYSMYNITREMLLKLLEILDKENN